jgi:hypothetical protein
MTTQAQKLAAAVALALDVPIADGNPQADRDLLRTRTIATRVWALELASGAIDVDSAVGLLRELPTRYPVTYTVYKGGAS